MKPLPSHSTVNDLFEYDGLDLKWKTGRRNLIGKTAGVVHYNGYRQIKIEGSYYLAHRLVWLFVTGEDPGENFIDHIDCNRLNNSFDNLRLASKAQNQANMAGVRAVYPSDSKSNPWRTSFRGRHLGVFKTKAEAEKAYRQAYEAHSGTWARKDRVSPGSLEETSAPLPPQNV